GHHAVLPNERMHIATRIERRADGLALVVDRFRPAHHVSRQRTQIGHRTLLPQEGMKGCVSGQPRLTDYLTSIVDTKRESEHPAPQTPEANQPPSRASWPEACVRGKKDAHREATA